jgi:hypothetical protein
MKRRRINSGANSVFRKKKTTAAGSYQIPICGHCKLNILTKKFTSRYKGDLAICRCNYPKIR